MTTARHSEPPAPVAFTADELVMINNALNEVCHGVDFDDDEFMTRLGYRREEVSKLLAKVSQLIKKRK
jgi:hypothetical protein